MKKLITLLILAVVCTGWALGASAGGNEFVIRAGIQFGMTIDQVRSLEQNAPAAEGLQDNGDYYLAYTNETVVNYPCVLAYAFVDNSLIHIHFNFTIPTHAAETETLEQVAYDFQQIESALIAKYGQPTSPYQGTYPADLNVNVHGYTRWEISAQRSYSVLHSLTHYTNGMLTHTIDYSSIPANQSDPPDTWGGDV